MKKILILSASPQRDAVVDSLLAEHLRKMGNKVWVRKCLREGRQSVLKFQPDVCVVPPVRNPYAADFAEQLKKWGIAVASRHTEASCDWKDFRSITEKERTHILSQVRYQVDVELVWGREEAEILTKRKGCTFKVVPCGSFMTDIYKQRSFEKKFLTRQEFCRKLNLAEDKKTILVGAPWGFVDMAPDLVIDEMRTFASEEKLRECHIAMIRILKAAVKGRMNILVRPHPGVDVKPYRDALDVGIDNQSSATEALLNCDYLIHGGSTMAVEMHLLNKPAFRFIDHDAPEKADEDWWWTRNTPLNRVSPTYDNAYSLIRAIITAKPKSNANLKTIERLEKGRFGLMDGRATQRAANIINQLKGKFTLCWPEAHKNYGTEFVHRSPIDVLHRGWCNICKKEFYIDKSYEKESVNCPWCASRIYRK
ncbi:MAG: hypothetical protein AMJ75_00280 [Phycisphaerae bacterium SM1_79]|nr:MAG: hypothetical protein AMJ75_00280 [Phycisphaerae bacterium SM1_79]